MWAQNKVYFSILKAIKDHDDLYSSIVSFENAQKKYTLISKEYNEDIGKNARNREDWKTDDKLWDELHEAELEGSSTLNKMIWEFSKKITVILEEERLKMKKRLLIVMFIGVFIGAATVFFNEKPRDPEMFRVMD